MMELSQTDIDEELKNLSGWSVVNEKLHKEFQFDSFNQASDFIPIIHSNSKYKDNRYLKGGRPLS